MIPFSKTRMHLLRLLDDEYQKLYAKHYEEQKAIGNRIPVGGGDWMDMFFRCEALRGCIGALRTDKSLDEAVAEGKTVSEISIRIWNGKREYQVHRWDKCCHSYLDGMIARLLPAAKELTKDEMGLAKSKPSCL